MDISAKVATSQLKGTLSVPYIRGSMSATSLNTSLGKVAILGASTYKALSASIVTLTLPCILAKGHNREVEADKMAYAKRVDTVGDVIYIGEAAVGTQDYQPLWRIKRTTLLDDGDDVVTEYADGNGNFDNSWEDRLTKSYS